MPGKETSSNDAKERKRWDAILNTSTTNLEKEAVGRESTLKPGAEPSDKFDFRDEQKNTLSKCVDMPVRPVSRSTIAPRGDNSETEPDMHETNAKMILKLTTNRSDQPGAQAVGPDDNCVPDQGGESVVPPVGDPENKTVLRKYDGAPGYAQSPKVDASYQKQILSLTSIHETVEEVTIYPQPSTADNEGQRTVTNTDASRQRNLRRPGAETVQGIDGSTAFVPEHGLAGSAQSSFMKTRPSKTVGELVEAQLVIHENNVVELQGEEVDVRSIRRRLIIGSLSVILVALVVGIGIGLVLDSGRRSDPLSIISNISASDLRAKDFDKYTVAPSSCFGSKEELYSIVDEYIGLRLAVDEAQNYLLVRNQSRVARDAIALVYGWPIGRFCVSRIQSFYRVFSAERHGGESTLIDFNEDISDWDVSNAHNMDELFKRASKFNTPLNSWNTSRVQSMASMFEQAARFNQSLEAWDTGNVENLTGMFRDAISFNQPLDSWDTGNVENTTWMFSDAISFNQSLESWDTRRVVDMGGMFKGAFAFNQPIGSWNTSSVREMIRMFQEAIAFNQHIGAWDVQHLLISNNMFEGAVSFNQDLSGWKLYRIRELSSMFWGARSFNQPSTCQWGLAIRLGTNSRMRGVGTGGMFDGTSCNITSNPQLDHWPITHLCGDCETYFRHILSAHKEDRIRASYPIESAATLRETVDRYMMYTLGHLSLEYEDAFDTRTQIAERFGWPIGAWNVSLITNFSLVFSIYRSRLVGVFDHDVSDWDVSNGRSFAWMFAGSGLFNQNLSQWDLSKATDTSGMFGDLRPQNEVTDVWNIENLPSFPGAVSFNQDISSWNTSRVTTMERMFQDARSFNQDISRWDTSNVYTMERMFLKATMFNSALPWNVSKVQNFNRMLASSNFSGDVSSWDTSNAVDLACLFCETPFDSDVSRWDVTSVTSMYKMFAYSNFSHNVSKWVPRSNFDFRSMWRHTPFNHNLCHWGPHLRKPGVRADFMFHRTGCPQTGDPDILKTPVSPLCHDCTGV